MSHATVPRLTTQGAMPATAAGVHVRERLTSAVTSIAITLVAVIAVGLVWVGPRFVSASNITIIGSFVAVPLLVGTCAGFALLAGVVDLSIGSMVGFGGTVFALLVAAHWSPWTAGGATLVICLIGGTINALAIVVFGASPIAASLGMLTALSGLNRVLLAPQGQVAALVPDLLSFTGRLVVSLPLVFLLALVVVALATVVVTRMRVGRHIQAVGGDDLAATRAGISVPRLRFAALLLSSFGAGLGGILYVGQLGSSSNVLGTGLEFQVYAALMIGGYSILRGGVGNPAGGAMGLLVVAGVANILDVKAISPYYVNIIVGLLLLAAVLIDRLRGGDAYE
jgi:ribose/xylose/arabinose/galactoside ABC-type transport system permease subunit